MFIKIYNDIVNYLSFAQELRSLRTKINISIDLPEVIAEFPDSHPRGFIKEFKKRRTTIVETYLRITKCLDSANYNQRIQALRLLSEHITYSRSLKMPLNAARVQLAIMKEVVKNRDNKRAQLELMSDFSVSSFGNTKAIRHYLKKFDMIEVPETGDELKDLKMGWDFHVHDSTSYGRKLPIQLIIDAFIKGISELTIVYSNLDQIDAIKEVLEAGKILGIKVNIALEFSALSDGLRFHYMYILPNFSSKKGKFKKFLKEKTDDFKKFLHELDDNEKKREKIIKRLIKNFNLNHLPKINEGYDPESIYYLRPFSINDEENAFGHKIYSRRQLGEFLFPNFKKVLEKRALQITALKIQTEESPELFTDQEIESIHRRFKYIRSQYQNLEPEKIRIEYFGGNESLMTEIAVSSLHDIYKLAKKSDCSIKFIQPLEHGLQSAIDLILENCRMLSHTEIYNIYDSIGVKELDFVIFANFIKLLNGGNPDHLVYFLHNNNLTFNEKQLFEAIDHLQQNKLIPSIGSDATGRSTLAPGMGFIFKNRIAKYQRKYFLKNHYILPDAISEMVFNHVKIPKKPLKQGEKPEIVCLGKLSGGKINMLGDEKIEKPIRPSQAWEYLNPVIKNLIFIIIGFVPAYLIVGPEYALLWFAITGSRNMFVDAISGKGLNPREWHAKDINWGNLAQSLFFTGFSVPILGFVKGQFDIIWTGPHEGTLFEVGKFFFINVTNGIYIASHNYLRGFDNSTTKANFFRSILAWPLAAAFSPFGNWLLLPSIVQAKFWSDFVGALIEGTAKYRNILRVKDMEMKKLTPDLFDDDDETEKLAMLDMIYFVSESNRAKTALIKQMIPQYSFIKKIKKFISGNKELPVPNESFHELKKRIDRKGTMNELVNFIIEHYNREQSLYLLKMVSENYYKLQRYFNRMYKKYGSNGLLKT